jgi:hypothetical protein
MLSAITKSGSYHERNVLITERLIHCVTGLTFNRRLVTRRWD